MPETKRLTEKDSGSSVSLHVKDRLAVTLPANPTTGYQWEIDGGDTNILRPIGDPVYEPTGNLPGSGGKTTFQFEAAGAGSTKLRLIYRRSFEKNVPPASTFELDVTVTE
jgi:inhibitor of cysteine peptidase